ncbi:cupin domain-containing protein [Herbaspirillum rhizosphaerae]|uniref:cupin domain-containing protein n=1 Tax=Herbaspirillum rhizosphaerae TaxID=346179 RepID=UPI000A5C719E|nr:cupin domain-containing protein [Herbaspirillum rhizosphaerae]
MNLSVPALSARGLGYRWLLLSLAGGFLLAQSSAPHAAAQWIADICSTSDTADLPFSSSAPMATSSLPSSATARPATSVKVISCEPLPNVPGKSITTMTVDFPPLAYSAPHRHPGSVTAIVLQGTVRSQMEGGPVVNYRQGETWMEAPHALHVLAENPDPVKPAQLLAIFVADADCGPLVIPEPASPAAAQ